MGSGTNRNRPCPCGSGLKYKKCCMGKPLLPLKDAADMTESDKEAIATILDVVTDAYLDNQNIVFRNDSERRALAFGWLAARKKAWEKSRTCMCPGCTNKSIRHSHTIPGSALRLIAEEGHLLHPEFNHSSEVVELAKIGINEASTFAGFCETHELEFQKFESVVQMHDDMDFILQMFRTVCREIAIEEHHILFFRQAIEDRRKRLEKWGSGQIEQQFRDKFQFSSKMKVRGFKIEADDLIAYGERKLESWESDLSLFRRSFFQHFLDAENSGRLVLNLNFFQHTLLERLPVALAGRGKFGFGPMRGRTGNEILAVLNVLPVKNGTEIFIFAPSEQEKALSSYISHFVAKEGERNGLISMVESWMLHGSDHWFLSPSTWKRLSETHKGKATQAIMDTSLNIGSRPAVGILNEIRNNPQPI